MANLGAKGGPTICDGRDVEQKLESDKRLVGRQRQKTGGQSGCGTVIKGIDKDTRVTVSDTAKPLQKSMQCLGSWKSWSAHTDRTR